MALQTKKQFLLGFLLLAGIGISLAFYFYNKGPVDVKNSRGIAVTATELYDLFSKDSLSAGKRYTGKIIEVTGELVSVTQNTKQEQVVLLKTGNDMASVNCTLEEPVDKLQPATKITVKGICSGIGQGEPELGILGDVYLTRSFITK